MRKSAAGEKFQRVYKGKSAAGEKNDVFLLKNTPLVKNPPYSGRISNKGGILKSNTPDKLTEDTTPLCLKCFLNGNL